MGNTRFDHTWTDRKRRARELERERAAKKAKKRDAAHVESEREKR